MSRRVPPEAVLVSMAEKGRKGAVSGVNLRRILREKWAHVTRLWAQKKFAGLRGRRKIRSGGIHRKGAWV